jgi:hypothetical protein
MRIAICGGGNAAHTLAGLLSAATSNQVRVFTAFEDEARRWQQNMAEGGVTVTSRHGQITGRPELVSADPKQAISQAELVLLATPAFAHQPVLEKISPYLESGALIGAIPARGCFDLCARRALGKKFPLLVVFGMQTLPWACRIVHYGREVNVLGIKTAVALSALPAQRQAEVVETITQLIGITATPIANFLSLTLAGTGQLIHPGIMYGLFHAWDNQPFKSPPLFYQGIDNATAEILQGLSDEVQRLRVHLEERFVGLDLSDVQPLIHWLQRSYQEDIADCSSLKSSFVSNRSYAGLRAPMNPVEGGFAPDFNARYLSEDIPFGLIATRGVAELCGLETPIIDQVILWAQDKLGKEYLRKGRLDGKDVAETRAPQRYGFTTIRSLMDLYCPDY